MCVWISVFRRRKQFENPIIGCRDIKQKPSLILFGTPCTRAQLNHRVELELSSKYIRKCRELRTILEKSLSQKKHHRGKVYHDFVKYSPLGGWVGGVDTLRIKLSQLSTKLKLKLKLRFPKS